MSGPLHAEDTLMDDVADRSGQLASRTPTQESAALHHPFNSSSAVASGSGVVRGADGAMFLRWEPGMTTTTTTHTTQTVTHFPPVRLPHPTSLLPPTTLPVLPTHLSPTRYPLSTTPTPEDLRFFALSLGGKRVIFREEGTTDEQEAEAERASKQGRGWVRCGDFDGSWGEEAQPRERIGIVDALSGSITGSGRDRAGKGKERETSAGTASSAGAGDEASSTSMSVILSPTLSASHRADQDNFTNSSPPRKRLRESDHSGLPTPHPANAFSDLHHSPSSGRARSFSSSSPTAQARPGLPTSYSTSSYPFPPPLAASTTTTTTTTSSSAQPSTGTGQELAMLYSLPSLLSTFDNLPPKLKEHFLMHCFRRSELSTIQRLSSFISPALKFDFVARFPTEISIAIFTFVPRSGLAAAARVSKKWNAMVDSQRGIWVGRMKEDGFWWGYGAEEEEEDLVRKRWEVKDRLDLDAKRSAELPLGTPVEGRTTLDGARVPFRARGWSLARSDEEARPRSHPLKQVYRMRQQSALNWTRSKPSGGRHMFNGHGAHVVTCLQFDTDKIVSASDDHSINIYDIKDGQLRCRLDGHEGGVWALQYKGDVLVSGSTDRTVRVWSIEKQEQTHVFHGHTSTVRCLQIVEPVRQPNGEFLPPYPLIVTGSRDSNIRIWRLPRKNEPEYRSPIGKNHKNRKEDDPVLPHENPFHNHCLEGHTNAVRAIAAYGQYCVSGSYDCTVRVWDIVKGTCLHVLRGHQQKVYSVVLDARRNRVASGSMDGTVKVWDLLHGTCLATLEGHGSLVGLLCISPNNLVSAAADSTIKIWDATTLACKHTLTAHQGAITCFQHDETKIISGSEGTLKMWDVRDGSFVRDLVTGVQGVWQVAFSGRHLVSASNRGGMTVFDVIDYGSCGYDDGAGDESLDELIIPDWERENRLEPRTYQDSASTDYPMYQPDSSTYDVYAPGYATALRHAYGQPFVTLAERAEPEGVDDGDDGTAPVSADGDIDSKSEHRTPIQHSIAPPPAPTSYASTSASSSSSSAPQQPTAVPPSFLSASTNPSSTSPSKRPHVPSKFEASPAAASQPSTSWASRATWGEEYFEERKRGEEMRRIRTRNEAERTGKKTAGKASGSGSGVGGSGTAGPSNLAAAAAGAGQQREGEGEGDGMEDDEDEWA